MKLTLTRSLAWATFCLLLAASAYGFISAKLFRQDIWTPTGKQRMFWLAGAYVVWFLVMSVWQRRLFVPATLVLATLYVCASAGFGAVAGAVLLLFSATVLGTWLLGENRGRELAPADVAMGDGLALLVGMSVYIWFVGLLVHVPINYSLTYLALLSAAPLGRPAIAAGVLRRWASLFRPRAPSGRLEHALLGLVIFTFICHTLVVLKPETSGDGLAMHLATAAWVNDFHQWHFDAQHLAWAVMPMGGDWCFTAAYLLGGEYAARLINFSLLGVSAGLLYCVVRRWASTAVGLLVVALLASTPVTQLVTGSLFVENVWAALLLGALLALWRHREEERTAWLYAAALLSGTAVASKFGALPFAAMIGAFGGVELYRRRKQTSPPTALAATAVAAIFLASAVPPYLTAWVKTRNPVFPFLNEVFKSPYFDSTTSLVDRRFQTPLAPGTLYDITFQTHKYLEGQDGALGFHYFLLLPLAVLLFRRDWPYVAKAALVIGLASCILTFRTQSNLRYLYPAFPLFLIAASVVLVRLSAVDRVLGKLVNGTAGAAVFLNLAFLPSSGWYHKDFWLDTVFRQREVEEYVREGAPARKLIEYLNRVNAGRPVSLVENNHIAGLRAKAYTNTWHNHRFVRRLRTASSAVDCLKLVNELGIVYFLSPTKESGIPIIEVQLEVLLDDFTTPEYSFGRYQVRRLKDEFIGENARTSPALPERRLAPAPHGDYDDTSQFVSYYGAWSRDNQFPDPVNGTLTYCDQPGASFRLAFLGSEVTYIYTKAFNRGFASVSIDGMDKGKIDQYSPETVWRERVRYGDLPEGNHVLVVRVMPEKNPASTGFHVDLDSLEVR